MSTTLTVYDSRVQVDGGVQLSSLSLSSEFSVSAAGAVAMAALNQLKLASTSSTIASGTFAFATPWHIVEGEGAAADDLDSVTGGAAGQLLVLTAANAAHDITVKHATGANKFQLASGLDKVLGITQDTIVLLHDGTNWNEICHSVNHA